MTESYAFTWDFMLIILSFVVATLGSYTTLQLVKQMASSRTPRSRYGWLTGASVSFGFCAVWSMHFIGMLGFTMYEGDKKIEVSFDMLRTFASMFFAMIGVFGGFWILFIPLFLQVECCYPNQEFHSSDDDGASISDHGGSQVGSSSIRSSTARRRKIRVFASNSAGDSLVDDETAERTGSVELENESLHEGSVYSMASNSVISSRNRARLLKTTVFCIIIRIISAACFTAMGVLAMHFFGMTAMEFKGDFYYKMELMAVTCILGIVVCAVANIILLFFSGELLLLLSAVIFGVAVCAVHYVGMYAIAYMKNPNSSMGDTGLSPERFALLVSIAALLTCFILIGISYGRINKQRETMEKLQVIINEEKQKSNEILNNILPETIAKRMKNGEHNITAIYRNCTIVFADMVGFTERCRTMNPHEVVRMLNEIYSPLDEIAQELGIEKIKTSGDAYMAVAGLPQPDPEHASRAVEFAAHMIDITSSSKYDGLTMRVGIATGPVAAGVIGKWKYVFDCFGDAVNYSSRLETTGTPGKIQIDVHTYSKLDKQQLEAAFIVEKREPFEIKGKGICETYFLTPKIPSDHADEYFNPQDPDEYIQDRVTSWRAQVQRNLWDSNQESSTVDLLLPPPIRIEEHTLNRGIEDLIPFNHPNAFPPAAEGRILLPPLPSNTVASISSEEHFDVESGERSVRK